MGGEAYHGGTHYAHHGEQDGGEEGGDGQGQSLGEPEERHEDDGVGRVSFLQAGGEQQSCWRGQACVPESCHLLSPEKAGRL